MLRGIPDEYRSRRRDTRSRSPVRDGHGARDSPRQRSPPRGPRGGRQSPSRAQPGLPSSHSARRGDTAPSSQAPSGPKSSDRGDLRNGPTAQHIKPTNGDAMDGDDEDDDPDVQMRRMMGFGNFRSTKNTKVPGNDKNYGVRKEKKTEYRQYMNRVGGFNRPLSPSR